MSYESELQAQFRPLNKRIAELHGEVIKITADRDRIGRNRDMWKGQVERQAELLRSMRATLKRAVEFYDGLDRLHDDGEAEMLDAMVSTLKIVEPASPVSE